MDSATNKTFALGNDLTVNRIGYGAMRITGKGVWHQPENKDEAIRVLQALPGLGVNFIDTADSYGPYVSEELIAEALYPYPAGIHDDFFAIGPTARPDKIHWSFGSKHSYPKKSAGICAYCIPAKQVQHNGTRLGT